MSTAQRLQRQLDREARRNDPEAQDAYHERTRNFLAAAHALRRQKRISKRTLDLATKYAITEHLLDELTPEMRKLAEQDGTLARYELNDADIPAAERAVAQIGALHISALVKSGHMKPSEGKRLLADIVEIPEHDDPDNPPSDADIVESLGELASTKDQLRTIDDKRPRPEHEKELNDWLADHYGDKGPKNVVPPAIPNQEALSQGLKNDEDE